MKYDFKLRPDTQLLFLLAMGTQVEVGGGEEYSYTEDRGLHQLSPKLLYLTSPRLADIAAQTRGIILLGIS